MSKMGVGSGWGNARLRKCCRGVLQPMPRRNHCLNEPTCAIVGDRNKWRHCGKNARSSSDFRVTSSLPEFNRSPAPRYPTPRIATWRTLVSPMEASVEGSHRTTQEEKSGCSQCADHQPQCSFGVNLSGVHARIKSHSNRLEAISPKFSTGEGNWRDRALHASRGNVASKMMISGPKAGLSTFSQRADWSPDASPRGTAVALDHASGDGQPSPAFVLDTLS